MDFGEVGVMMVIEVRHGLVLERAVWRFVVIWGMIWFGCEVVLWVMEGLI
jgi:hypothetical protein